jgi:hypothetical protein
MRIFSSNEFLVFWDKFVSNQKRDLSNYLESFEKDGENGKEFCLIDLGWNGTIQNNLALSMKSNQRIQGLYMGITHKAKDIEFSRSAIDYLIATQGRDYFSHGLFNGMHLNEYLTLAPHESFSSIACNLDEKMIHDWVAQHPEEKLKISYQKNAIAMMKPIYYLNLIYWPKSENISALTRITSFMYSVFPSKQFAREFLGKSTSFGYRSANYRIIDSTIEKKIEASRKSIWKFGAVTHYFGYVANLMLLIRNQLSWNLSSGPEIYFSRPRDYIEGKSGRATPPLKSESKEVNYSDLIQVYGYEDVHRSRLRSRDFVLLFLSMKLVNLLRMMRGLKSFKNHSLPICSLFIKRSFF